MCVCVCRCVAGRNRLLPVLAPGLSWLEGGLDEEEEKCVYVWLVDAAGYYWPQGWVGWKGVWMRYTTLIIHSRLKLLYSSVAASTSSRMSTSANSAEKMKPKDKRRCTKSWRNEQKLYLFNSKESATKKCQLFIRGGGEVI